MKEIKKKERNPKNKHGKRIISQNNFQKTEKKKKKMTETV